MKVFIRALAITAAVCIPLAGATALAHPSGSATTVKLQLKWLPQSQFMGYYVAAARGYYKHQSLNVDILPGGESAPETIVEGGGAQFGVDWMAQLLAARQTGQNVVRVAQIFQATGMRMIAFKSAHIKSVRDFKGRTVEVWPGGNQYQFFALMHKYGFKCSVTAFTCKGLTVKSEPFVMDDFVNHKTDLAQAMTYNELGIVDQKPPTGTYGIPESKLTVFDYNKLGVSMLEDGLFADGGWLKSHGAIAVKFIRASIQGWKYAVAHPTYAGTVCYDNEGTNGETLAHQIYMAQKVAKLTTYQLKGHQIGWLNPASYTRTWKEAKQDGIISSKPVNATNMSFWSKAIKGL
jgi:NitT/TauT family transport system substrate-binding protein